MINFNFPIIYVLTNNINLILWMKMIYKYSHKTKSDKYKVAIIAQYDGDRSLTYITNSSYKYNSTNCINSQPHRKGPRIFDEFKNIQQLTMDKFTFCRISFHP